MQAFSRRSQSNLVSESAPTSASPNGPFGGLSKADLKYFATPSQAKQDVEPECPASLVSIVSSGDEVDDSQMPSNNLMWDGIALTNYDLHCLDDGCMLNDTVVEFFLRLMQTCIGRHGHIHIFSPHFFTRLQANGAENGEVGWENVKGWTKRTPLFANKLVVVPINSGNHWWLAVVQLPDLEKPASMPTLYWVDSCRGSGELYAEPLHYLRGYLHKEWIASRDALNDNGICISMSRDINYLEMPCCSVEAAPQQENFVDCGIFMLENVRVLLREPNIFRSSAQIGATIWCDQARAVQCRDTLRQIVRTLKVEAVSANLFSVPDLFEKNSGLAIRINATMNRDERITFGATVEHEKMLVETSPKAESKKRREDEERSPKEEERKRQENEARNQEQARHKEEEETRKLKRMKQEHDGRPLQIERLQKESEEIERRRKDAEEKQRKKDDAESVEEERKNIEEVAKKRQQIAREVLRQTIEAKRKQSEEAQRKKEVEEALQIKRQEEARKTLEMVAKQRQAVFQRQTEELQKQRKELHKALEMEMKQRRDAEEELQRQRDEAQEKNKRDALLRHEEELQKLREEAHSRMEMQEREVQRRREEAAKQIEMEQKQRQESLRRQEEELQALAVAQKKAEMEEKQRQKVLQRQEEELQRHREEVQKKMELEEQQRRDAVRKQEEELQKQRHEAQKQIEDEEALKREALLRHEDALQKLREEARKRMEIQERELQRHREEATKQIELEQKQRQESLRRQEEELQRQAVAQKKAEMEEKERQEVLQRQADELQRQREEAQKKIQMEVKQREEAVRRQKEELQKQREEAQKRLEDEEKQKRDALLRHEEELQKLREEAQKRMEAQEREAQRQWEQSKKQLAMEQKQRLESLRRQNEELHMQREEAQKKLEEEEKQKKQALLRHEEESQQLHEEAHQRMAIQECEAQRQREDAPKQIEEKQRQEFFRRPEEELKRHREDTERICEIQRQGKQRPEVFPPQKDGICERCEGQGFCDDFVDQHIGPRDTQCFFCRTCKSCNGSGQKRSTENDMPQSSPESDKSQEFAALDGDLGTYDHIYRECETEKHSPDNVLVDAYQVYAVEDAELPGLEMSPSMQAYWNEEGNCIPQSTTEAVQVSEASQLLHHGEMKENPTVEASLCSNLDCGANIDKSEISSLVPHQKNEDLHPSETRIVEESLVSKVNGSTPIEMDVEKETNAVNDELPVCSEMQSETLGAPAASVNSGNAKELSSKVDTCGGGCGDSLTEICSTVEGVRKHSPDAQTGKASSNLAQVGVVEAHDEEMLGLGCPANTSKQDLFATQAEKEDPQDDDKVNDTICRSIAALPPTLAHIEIQGCQTSGKKEEKDTVQIEASTQFKHVPRAPIAKLDGAASILKNPQAQFTAKRDKWWLWRGILGPDILVV